MHLSVDTNPLAEKKAKQSNPLAMGGHFNAVTKNRTIAK